MAPSLWLRRLWYCRNEGFLRKAVLSPLWLLSLFYRCAVALRVFLYSRGLLKSRALPCRVLCVGNLTVGGTGKTPCVMVIAGFLKDEGLKVGVVSRGYARGSRGSALVSDGKEVLLRPEEAGDEPFLLAQKLPGVPVAVGEDRYDAASLLLSHGALDAVILDDGFAHLGLQRDMDILMFKGGTGLGNGRLLPRGPLREPLNGLRRAQGCVIVCDQGGEDQELKDVLRDLHPGARIFDARYRLRGFRSPRDGRLVSPGEVLSSRLLAFCGIADPGSFFSMLRDMGLPAVKEVAYPDHYWYTDKDLVNIAAITKKTGAESVITTEKDYVRIARILPRDDLPLLVAEREMLIDENLKGFILSSLTG